MGNLLRVLYNKDENSAAIKVDIFVDFENAQPTERELETWTLVDEKLRYTEEILHQLRNYKAASNEIRDAISHPSNENYQERASSAVIPLVAQLRKFYQFSLELENVVVQLLRELCSADMTPKQHLESQQALFKQFAEILDFVLKFDELKMNNPSVQNDFSYYRRTQTRSQMMSTSSEHPLDDMEADVIIGCELANQMSLFYAHATPMLHMLSDTTSRFVSQNKDVPIENTTDCLSTMASICRVMITNPVYRSKFQNEETVMFSLRVMVGVIILYDHVHPVGAFTKPSSIDVKNCIKALKDQPNGQVESLLNALRYTTKHLHDETTPKTIKNLLS